MVETLGDPFPPFFFFFLKGATRTYLASFTREVFLLHDNYFEQIMIYSLSTSDGLKDKIFTPMHRIFGDISNDVLEDGTENKIVC